MFLQSLASRPGASGTLGGWLAPLPRATRNANRDRPASRGRRRFVNPIALLRAMEPRPPKKRSGRRRRRLRGHRLVHNASRAARSAWSTPAPSAPWAWGPASPWALKRAARTRFWIVFGDGACGFGLAEFDTFVRHGVPVIAVVGNDAGWTQIARDQVRLASLPTTAMTGMPVT